MKILVTSDIHQNINLLKKVKKRYPNHYHIDAGDSVLDNKILLDLKITSVKGNCDFNNNLEVIKIINCENKKILITHGHLFNVKMGLDKIVLKALNEKAQYLIFGHTHIPLLKEINNLKIINPGSLNEGSYVLIEDEKIKFKTV